MSGLRTVFFVTSSYKNIDDIYVKIMIKPWNFVPIPLVYCPVKCPLICPFRKAKVGGLVKYSHIPRRLEGNKKQKRPANSKDHFILNFIYQTFFCICLSFIKKQKRRKNNEWMRKMVTPSWQNNHQITFEGSIKFFLFKDEKEKNNYT